MKHRLSAWIEVEVNMVSESEDPYTDVRERLERYQSAVVKAIWALNDVEPMYFQVEGIKYEETLDD